MVCVDDSIIQSQIARHRLIDVLSHIPSEIDLRIIQYTPVAREEKSNPGLTIVDCEIVGIRGIGIVNLVPAGNIPVMRAIGADSIAVVGIGIVLGDAIRGDIDAVKGKVAGHRSILVLYS